METLTVKVPTELSKWLSQHAQQRKQSKAQIAAEALEALRRKEQGLTVTTRAGDLVGRFASGHSDASHKRHLKGFGR